MVANPIDPDDLVPAIPVPPAAPARCFFTAVTGAGTISNETYEADTIPANQVLTGFTSNNPDVTVTVVIYTGEDRWMPDFVEVQLAGATTVRVTKDSFTQLVTDARIWTVDLNISDADDSGTIKAVLPNGETSTCLYTRSTALAVGARVGPSLTHLAQSRNSRWSSWV